MDASYRLGTPNWRAAVFAACVLLVPTLITWGAFRFAAGSRVVGVVVVVGVLVLPWVLLLLAQMFLVSARLLGGQLHVGGGLYKERIPLCEIDADGIAIVDAGHGKVALTYRKNGVGMPGLSLGWFASRSGRDAFVALSRRDRVVLVPTTRGHDVVVSPQDPEGFVRDLRQALAPQGN